MKREGSIGSDDGSGIMEAIVALVVIAAGLAAFSQAASNVYRTSGRLKMQGAALAVTRAHLDLLAQDGALEEGSTSGRYPNDLPWRMTVAPLIPARDASSAQVRPVWITLETFDRRGMSLVKLETAKLIREAP
jgi:hypothetical protein